MGIRWAIEQQYQELKTELGFDHFEGRSYLQRERMRRGTDQSLTFPGIRAIVQELFTALHPYVDLLSFLDAFEIVWLLSEHLQIFELSDDHAGLDRTAHAGRAYDQ